MEILHNPNFDFLGKTKILMSLSLVIIVTGMLYIWQRGVRYGVEFEGGTQLILRFDQSPDATRVRRAADTVAQGALVQAYDRPETHQMLVRLPEAKQTAEGEISGSAQALLKALGSLYPENPVKESSTEIVGPIVGAELRQKAILLTVLGLAGQLVYIAWRFRGVIWGSAATIAAFHDVLITVGLLAILRYEITLNVIAALLTLVGYSMNDTIVIFDRVRENLRQRRKEPLSKIINDSVNQTLSRTLISSGTTFLTVLGLFIFGGEVLRGFGFTMVVGIVVGTYSTIYIASPIVVWWQGLLQGGSTPAPAVSKAK
jgi:preprotein translocase subunit SecF